MPTKETLENFIARVEANAYIEAFEEFYTEDATIQENTEPPIFGRDVHIAQERKILAQAKTLKSKCVRPAFMEGDKVVLRWIFHAEWQDGTVTHLEQLAYQRWEGERIADERFFYDPAQRVPVVEEKY